MRIAILSKTVCPPTQNVIEFFVQNELYPDCVIIEKNFRKKFSENEIKFRKSHDKFNRKTKKYPFFRRFARRIWDLMPIALQGFIQKEIYTIPLLNRVSLKRFCTKRGIDVFEVAKHSSSETKDIILERGIDYLLMVSSNWLLKEPIISMENSKIINAHSGWLPKHKGLDSIAWSIIEKDKVGLTTHFIDSGIDSGSILRFYEADITTADSFNTITKKVGSLQAKAFFDTLEGLKNNEITPICQDDSYLPHKPMSFEELWEINERIKSK